MFDNIKTKGPCAFCKAGPQRILILRQDAFGSQIGSFSLIGGMWLVDLESIATCEELEALAAKHRELENELKEGE